MKCFYDPTQDAVGTCKSCQRGISHEYLTEIGKKGIACRGRCEEDAAALIALIERNIESWATAGQMIKRTSIINYGSGIFMIVIGLAFTLQDFRMGEIGFTSYIGPAFVVYGIWTLVRARHDTPLVPKASETESGQK